MKLKRTSWALIVAGAVYSTSCVYDEIPTGFDCATSDLAISLSSKKNASGCKAIDGQIIVAATGGTPAYDFSLGDRVYQTNPSFDALAPGVYLVTVKDMKGCKASLEVDVAADNSDLNASTTTLPDNMCLSDNGSISVIPSGGQGPYSFKIDTGVFGTNNIFASLKSGNHTVIVKDNNDCERILIVNVPRGDTGLSFANDITPIFTANCNFNGCHGAGSTGRDWTKYADVKANALDIKTRTGNRSMPIGGFTLTQDQIDRIACWVDDGANNN